MNIARAFDGRPHYVRDDGISLIRLAIVAFLLLPAAAGVGWVLNWMYLNEHYHAVLDAAVAGLVMAGLLYLGIGKAHCRNGSVAGSLGALAGTFAYLSFYYFGMLAHLPQLGPERVDALPHYIAQVRLKRDAAVNLLRPWDRKALKPNESLNRFHFVMELGFLIVMPAAVAVRRSQRAYSRRHGDWLTWNAARFKAHSGREILEAILMGLGLQPFPRVASFNQGDGPCRVVLETAPQGVEDVSLFPAYLSVEDSRSRALSKHLVKRIVWQVELTLPEIESVLTLFREEASRWRVSRSGSFGEAKGTYAEPD
ncbi:MAG: hypothetical protein IT428_26865 [Planctomycetaceae bacterium]|nr:hypothetical protein [Planctomycetaceae bacterium]